MHQRTVLQNGIRLVTERIDHIRTVAVGIWVNVGSRDEHDLNNGCAHFVEHMFFKGTRSRSARQIARELDILGGMSNAFTSNETTCFYGTVLDSNLPHFVDLLTDLFQNSLFAREEIDRERQVILQEISMVEDTPDDQVHELFSALLWGKHPLGHTVLGSREVVSAMDSHHLTDYVERFYTPDRILIAAAGHVDHEAFCALWQDRLNKIAVRACGVGKRVQPTPLPPVRKIYRKSLEQLHIVLGTYGLPITADERYTLYLLNVLLGGNMSSRLFQEVREKRGLAYSIYSYLASHSDSGSVSIYMGIDPEKAGEAIALIGAEIDRFCSHTAAGEELRNAKDYAKSGLYLAAENMEARMTRIARNELWFGRHIPLEEVVAGIEEVSGAAVRQLAETVFGRQPLTVAGLGPLKTGDINWRPLG